MTNEEISIYVGKLLQWREEGASIFGSFDYVNDSFEIEIYYDGIRTYQEFNLYQGKKVWSMYNEALSNDN